MADATSSGSGSSGHSEGRRRIHPRTCGGSKPSSSNADPSLVHEHLKPPSEHSLGKAVELLQSNQEDRETAKRAVAIVLKATRKRGFKGAVSLCTEVTSLLEQNRRLERIVSLQRSELLSHASSQKALSSSYGSNRSCRRTTEHKANQIQPVLVNRSTSPLLKEVYVKSPRNQTAQTEFSSTDTKWRHKKDTSEMGCSTVTMDEIDENEDPMTKAKEKWLKLQEENVQLKNELFNVKNELESFKKKAVLPPIILESQTAASKAVASLDQQGKGKNILPEPPTQRQAGSINTEVELPHVPHAKLPGQTLDNKPKGCTQQQRKKGFRPFSSPVKVAPNQPVQRQPIRPVEMYAQCKCAGCTRALWEESVTVLCDPSHTTDKKSPKQSEILPRIGDHVVVRSHLTGVVKYIGPVSGEKQPYIGLHLDSPVGNHSGSVDGVQYFSCPPNYGALVPLDDILCITSSNTFEVKQGVGSSLTSLRSFSTRATVGCQTHKKAQTF